MEFSFSIGLHAPSWLILALMVPLVGMARAMVRDRRTFGKPHIKMLDTKNTAKQRRIVDVRNQK
jgi:hypothetical protein